MARVAITEYAAKRLCFGDAYEGVSATPETLAGVISGLPDKQTYVVKIDAGVKKRGKQGLLAVNIAKTELEAAAQDLFQKGYERVVIEPFVAHIETDEHYVSLELVRDGVLLLQSDQGGVEVEAAKNLSIYRKVFSREQALAEAPVEVDDKLVGVPLNELLATMQQYHLSFLEINPYLALDIGFSALDMAAEIDSAKEAKLPVWVQEHVLHKKAASEAEKKVLEQDARTQAALNLHTLNKNGSILTLLSGGGASLVGLDSLVSSGLQEEVVNYSEYSGAPTRDETAEYVRTLLGVLFSSTAKNKVILVAGGVANFTDVMATFQGIVDVFADNLETIKDQKIYVCVRRGGPNQDAGLAHLRDFLDENDIPNDVNDPTLSLGKVGELVKQHI